MRTPVLTIEEWGQIVNAAEVDTLFYLGRDYRESTRHNSVVVYKEGTLCRKVRMTDRTTMLAKMEVNSDEVIHLMIPVEDLLSKEDFVAIQL